MGKIAVSIILTERERSLLEKEANRNQVGVALKRRILVILYAFQGKSNKEIATLINSSAHFVGKWRNRWHDNYEALQHRSHGFDGTPLRDSELLAALLTLPGDAPRSGCPPTFTDLQCQLLMSLATEKPEDHGIPVQSWTHELLAKTAVAENIVASISPKHYGNLLKKNELAPHKSAYWLFPNIGNKKEEFTARMEKICEVYGQQSTQPVDGLQVSCTDEKTGIQAIENIKVAPMREGCVECRDPEYRRNGTQMLMASRNVATGEINAYTIGDERKEAGFLQHVKAIVAAAPDQDHLIICDQLNTHKSTSLVEWEAKKIDFQGELGKKGRAGILQSMKSRQAFLEDESHSIRFLYTPKRCSWLNQIENRFALLTRKVLKKANFPSVETLKEKIKQFIDYYNGAMAKPYVWKSTGKKICNGFTT